MMAAEVLAAGFVAVREATTLVAAGVALSCADDLLVDAIFVARRGWRRLTVPQAAREPQTAALAPATGPFAILVPAWDEAAVIGDMLRHMTATLREPALRILVGTYPNDPATVAAVAAVGDPRVVAVSTGHPGPTTKADCLNALWSALLAVEAAAGRRVRGVILHDAEDVVHADELRVFAHHLGACAMVQLPVVPLPDRTSRWVSGHYLDEFAESHAKEMIVRAALGTAVPSAGVACAIDRAVLGRIADAAGGRPFDPACLTEDYELGHRIHAMGLRAAMIRVRTGQGVATVATREHFPATLDAAVRQKARWLLGIALQGWDRIGWRGGWAGFWMLVRDRKGVLTAALTLAGYGLALAALGLTAVRAVYPPFADAPPLIEPGSATAALLGFNMAALGWRLAMRALFTGRTHGWREGLRAPPRAVVANIINFLAAVRALRIYVAIGRGTARTSWDKTRHAVHRQGA